MHVQVEGGDDDHVDLELAPISARAPARPGQYCIGCGCLSLKFCAMFNPDDVAGRRGSGARYVLDEPGAN